MRKLIVQMHTTLDGRIANADGGFWEPFTWGDEEMRHVNDLFRGADTWAFGRAVHDAVVPWWTVVARGERPDGLDAITPAMAEFAEIFAGLTKVVFSTTLESSAGCVVVRSDVVGRLSAMKREAVGDIVLSCGPAMLGPVASTPGLVDEYVIVLHPAVLTAGPRLFDQLTHDLTLELTSAQPFEAGAVALRYRVRSA